MNTDRPSFGTKRTFTEEQTAPALAQEVKPLQRVEAGASWVKVGKTGTNYMTGVFYFTKEDLQSLLDSPVNKDGKHEFNVVAFPNKNYENNPKRPFWRFYRDNK
jgi:hypothetical protein